MLRDNCNRPMLLIERQRAMLLEGYKCIHELGPRYRHDMFTQKSIAYDYRDPSILTLLKYNTITHGKKYFIHEGAKLWNSISNGIKTIEDISKLKTLLIKWNGSLCISSLRFHNGLTHFWGFRDNQEKLNHRAIRQQLFLIICKI